MSYSPAYDLVIAHVVLTLITMPPRKKRTPLNDVIFIEIYNKHEPRGLLSSPVIVRQRLNKYDNECEF